MATTKEYPDWLIFDEASKVPEQFHKLYKSYWIPRPTFRSTLEGVWTDPDEGEAGNDRRRAEEKRSRAEHFSRITRLMAGG